MANSNLASLGRMSSQMLTYLGTQRTIKDVGGSYVNTFKYVYGPTTFVDAGSLLQSELGGGVVSNFSPTSYDSTKSYFLSRSVGSMYADTMTALTLDMSSIMGISPQTFLERSESQAGFTLLPNAYRVFNELRDPTHQVGTVTTVTNRTSLQARAIRS